VIEGRDESETTEELEAVDVGEVEDVEPGCYIETSDTRIAALEPPPDLAVA
jgi:hypothetical protein